MSPRNTGPPDREGVVQTVIENLVAPVTADPRPVSMGDRSTAAQKLAPALWTLLALFLLRVAGQAIVAFAVVPWLPPMAEWYSGHGTIPIVFHVVLATFAILFARHHRRALATAPTRR